MPPLTKEAIQNFPVQHKFKFVRQGDVVWWDQLYMEHNLIAQQAKMSKPNDAGSFYRADLTKTGKIIMTYGGSFTLDIIKVNTAEREQTIKIMNNLADGSDIKIE